MSDPFTSAWEAQRAAIGAYLRAQRQLANMSLRELASATSLSNAYLSQIERGLHEPSLRVLIQIGDVLDFSMEDVLGHSAPKSEDAPVGVEDAIAADADLSDAEKQALLAVYRSYVEARRASPAD